MEKKELQLNDLYKGGNRIKGDQAVFTVSEAIICSMSNYGHLDIEYLSNLLGKDKDRVIKMISKLAFQNPLKRNNDKYTGWETKDEYISGNLYKKLQIAKKYNIEYPGVFEKNIEVLQRFLPKRPLKKDIYLTLGSPWIPSTIIEEFVLYICNRSAKIYNEHFITYDDITGVWNVKNYGYFFNPKFETMRVDFYRVLENTLNQRDIVIRDKTFVKEARGPDGKPRDVFVINKEETELVVSKQRKLVEEFQKWIWQDNARAELIANTYHRLYGGYIKRRFDGSFLTFPGMNEKVELYDYQKDAIARIIFSKNTLLAHDVGSGKTYEMIVAGHEMKRMKMASRILYAVPNNLVSQREDMYKYLYRDAKILVISPDNFKKAKRNEILNRIVFEDYDGIIMAQSCFDLLEVSFSYKMNDIKAQIKEIENKYYKLINAPTKVKIRYNYLKSKLEKASLNEVKRETLTFNELKIDRLFVDEAHNYKNITIESNDNMSVYGARIGSKKAEEMVYKVRDVQERGGGVIFATATPISNSISDIFVMQSYLQRDELTEMHIQNFDSWVANFAEKDFEFEVDVDTTKFRVSNRITKFHNLTDLSTILSQIADFHEVEDKDKYPDFHGYSDVIIKKSADFAAFLQEISERADLIRNKRVTNREDNLLKLTVDGRKGALELRLIDPDKYKFDKESKVAICANNIYSIYEKYNARKLTQLVFCDISIMKDSFNVYEELKNLLIEKGIKPEEIAFIHDAESDEMRDELYRKVNEGEIRVLIGSTVKLGVGVNVQEKLIAIHHLDVPWRPSDMVQREGRILRQGNSNKEVYIYRYIVEGSFDAYSWQILERKQKFISHLLNASLYVRDADDIDETVLNYGEIKALAIGNMKIKRRFELYNEIQRLKNIEFKQNEYHEKLQDDIRNLEESIPQLKESLENIEKDIELYDLNKDKGSIEERRRLRSEVIEKYEESLLKGEETKIDEYLGFEIWSPGIVFDNKRFIYLVKNGKYRIEINLSGQGVVLKIDNFLEDLPNYKKEVEEKIIKSQEYYDSAVRELTQNNKSYTFLINHKMKELKEIDEELQTYNA